MPTSITPWPRWPGRTVGWSANDGWRMSGERSSSFWRTVSRAPRSRWRRSATGTGVPRPGARLRPASLLDGAPRAGGGWRGVSRHSGSAPGNWGQPPRRQAEAGPQLRPREVALIVPSMRRHHVHGATSCLDRHGQPFRKRPANLTREATPTRGTAPHRNGHRRAPERSGCPLGRMRASEGTTPTPPDQRVTRSGALAASGVQG
jgi:hypothetical protein